MDSRALSPNIWLFQYQLSRYDLLDEAAKGEREDWWRASRHRRRMQVGEQIYFLRAAGKADSHFAAIVAQGTIISKVEPQDCADCYPWIIKVRYDALVTPPITRDDFRHDEIIGRYLKRVGYEPLTVGKQGTQFLIPPTIAERLAALIADKNRLSPLSRPATPPVPQPSTRSSSATFAEYKPANEEFSAAVRDMIHIDAKRLERANQSHAKLQNSLYRHLLGKGLRPFSPAGEEPQFDIAWHCGFELFVAEVKSLTDENEETQLRLGLAQVLMYRHRLAEQHQKPVRAVLMLERLPTFEKWFSLCKELGVILVWDRHLDELDHVLATSTVPTGWNVSKRTM